MFVVVEMLEAPTRLVRLPFRERPIIRGLPAIRTIWLGLRLPPECFDFTSHPLQEYNSFCIICSILPATTDGHFEDMMSSDHNGAACFRQKRFWIRRAVLWLDSQDQTSTMAPTRACADHLQPQRSDRLTITFKGKCVLDRIVHNKAADTTSPERLDIASLRIATTRKQQCSPGQDS